MKWLIAFLLVLSTSAWAQNSRARWQEVRTSSQVARVVLSHPRGYLRFTCTLEASSGTEIPEVTIDVTFREGPLRSTEDLIMRADTFSQRLAYIGNVGEGLTRFSWTAWLPADINTALQLVDSANSRFTISNSQGQETFEADLASGASTDVVRRCNPASIRARGIARRTTSVNALITLSDDANGRCRGTSDFSACDEREAYGERLRELGWCYGRPNDLGYQRRWRRCGS